MRKIGKMSLFMFEVGSVGETPEFRFQGISLGQE